jgi:streptogramin lyase
VALAVGSGEAEGVWTANRLSSSTSRVSFDGRLIETYRLPTPPNALTVGFGSVWVASDDSDVIYRLTPTTGQTETIPVPAGPTALVSGSDSVWVCAADARVIARIDPSTNSVTDRLDVNGNPLSIASDANGGLWVGVGHRGLIVPVAP